MKIKVNSLVMLGIAYCIACQCKWLTIIGLDGSIWLNIERIMYVLLFLYCRFGKEPYAVMRAYYKKIDQGMVIVYLVGILELIYTVISNNAGVQGAITTFVYSYVKLLAVYPLLYLFVFHGYKKTEKIIVVVSTLSMIYQAIVAFLYNAKGMIISKGLMTNEEWIRNGNIRISSTCLIWMLFIIWFCKAINERNINKRNKHVLWSVIAILFMILVNQSRSLYVAAIGAGMFVYLFHERRGQRKFVAFFALLISIVVLSQSSMFSNFMASFAKGSEGDTLTGRMELLELIQKVPRSRLFGFGFVGSTIQLSSSIAFYFVDYGLIGDLLQLGIFAVTLYLVTGSILLQNALKLSKHKGFGFDFTIGALGFWIIGTIGFTVLSSARNFAIPVVLAISQYYAIKCGEE